MFVGNAVIWGVVNREMEDEARMEEKNANKT